MGSESEMSSGNEGDLDSPSARTLDGDAPLPMKATRKGSSMDLNTIDRMTRRLLVAASRTGTGGDAYFVVRDLFGGDEVEVVPASRPSVDDHVHGHTIGGPTIELVVRLASVTIRCHGIYDVYPKGGRECEPLIRLHTTTSEMVALREVRVGANSATGSVPSPPGALEIERSPSSSPARAPPTVLVLQERMESFTGERSLSVRPASYERVQVWNTPS